MTKIHAIYENGVFRPREPVSLPERAEVEFEPRQIQPAAVGEALEGVYEVLSHRYESGETDVAQHHNEHQP